MSFRAKYSRENDEANTTLVKRSQGERPRGEGPMKLYGRNMREFCVNDGEKRTSSFAAGIVQKHRTLLFMRDNGGDDRDSN